MATVKSVSKLKLGDIIHCMDVDYVYQFQNVICNECMLVERERRDNYTWYKFLIIDGDYEGTNVTHMFLRYFDESSKIAYLYNVKEIIGCRSAIHR